MSRAFLDAAGVTGRRWSPGLRGWLKSERSRLQRYRPRVEDWRFWAVQGLVVAVAGAHVAVESVRPLEGGGQEHALSFAPISLFFVPVVYASLNFGFVGSVATALWCALLAVPNIIVFHHGVERMAELLQLSIVVAVAVVAGQRVDRETAARQRAEAATAAMRASESKYRGLFESSPAAVLVLDPAGTILDASPAAGALFGMTLDGLKGVSVEELVGTDGARRLLNPTRGGDSQTGGLVWRSRDGAEAYLEPAVIRTTGPTGEPVVQVLLRDVTAERQRQAGLKAYAAHVLRVQEEERRRIAHELHDDTVQALILLCRQLDLAESVGGPLAPPLVDELREAREAAAKIAGDLRDFARALRPLTLEDLGLVTSIRRLLMDLSERTEMRGRLRVLGRERRLPADVEVAVFRIIQESLRNAERHSRGTRVGVTLDFAGDECKLRVSDDGVGFVPPVLGGDFAMRGQLGLLGVQERAELLGGTFEIRSSPGRGTTVTVSVPVQSAAVS